jgi:hypothetical protein
VPNFYSPVRQIFAAVLALSLASSPLAIAQSNNAQDLKQQVLAVVQSQKAVNGVRQELQSQNLALIDATGQPTSYEAIVQSKIINFALVGSATVDTQSDKLAVQYIGRANADGSSMQVTLAIYKYQEGAALKLANAMASTSLHLSAGQNAQEAKLAYDRAIRVLQTAASDQAKNGSAATKSLVAKIGNLLIPAANADLDALGQFIARTGGLVFKIGLIALSVAVLSLVVAGATRTPAFALLAVPGWIVGVPSIGYGILGWIIGKLIGIAAAPPKTAAQQ